MGLLLLTACNHSLTSGADVRPRTIVCTDGEVDDMDSFIRLLLYSNELDIEALVYSSSQWHYKGDGKGTLFTSEMPFTAQRYGERTDLRWPGTSWMQDLLKKYASVHPNLLKHDTAYPSPDYLQSIIRTGNIDFEGEMELDTEGSNFIKDILLDDEEGSVYILIWGGTNTLARALKSIENDYKDAGNWEEIYLKVANKAVIYTILDQDATYSSYVAPNWPDIRVIYNAAQFWSFAYMWPRVVPKSLKPYMEGDWFARHIKFNHGPLLGNYYLWGDGSQIPGDPEHTHGDTLEMQNQNRKRYDFISEGDSPSFFHLLNFGLRSTEDPTYGGLGGRFIRSTNNPNRWEDGSDAGDYNPETDQIDPSYPQVRWIEVLQNDFAARADWCVNEYGQANHAPVIRLVTAADRAAKPDETVSLSVSVTDPDGDNISCTWWQYLEAGSCKTPVKIEGANEMNASFTVPGDAVSGESIHVLLEVKDTGSPVLTSFARTVILVE